MIIHASSVYLTFVALRRAPHDDRAERENPAVSGQSGAPIRLYLV
jgi:hypothetical protein